ncbi:MAG: hypothetical protein GY856_53465 [bacterium]|nr:hypothetical protein [bacterium]
MVKAILARGSIQPVSPVPRSWTEGQELVIEEAPPDEDREDLEGWSREIDELASRMPKEDFDRLDRALAKADREAKEYVRRRMGSAE